MAGKRATQARAKSRTREQIKADKEARLREYVRLMAEGAWIPGVTGPEMARKYGINESTVAREAGEASRIIRSSIVGDDELRSMMVATLQTIVSRCMKGRQMRTGVEAIKAMAGLTGIEAPKKLDIGGSLGDLLAFADEPEGSGSEAPEKMGE